MAEHPEHCYYCGRFLAWAVWARNWCLIQAPGVADPEPYEISWCDDCGARSAARTPGGTEDG